MHSRVVALVVTTQSGQSTQRTLDALKAQSRPLDEIIVTPTHKRTATGVAVKEALTGIPERDAQFLWILVAGSVPAPDALARLLGGLEVAPSVAVVGPKIMDGSRPDHIASFGLSMTRFGRTVSLVSDELDQAQHDRMSDVLAVDTNGLLVRDEVWRELDGFDPGLPHVDDALDFCVRVRLSGHRVEVVPQARVIAPAVEEEGEYRGRARLARQERAAQLHRRLSYTRAVGVPWHWLGLLPNALWRTLVLLINKRPTAVGGELMAALSVLVTPGSAARARKSIRRTRSVSWSTLDSLILPWAEVRRRDALARETLRMQLHGQVAPTMFLATGGGWVLLTLAVVSFVLMVPLIGASAIGGGALLPLGNDLGALWNQVGFGWRAGSLSFLAPADPFAIVVATLGSLTWWNPSLAVVILWFMAIPFAGLGAWLFASRITPRPLIRAFVAIGYALAPTLLVSMAAGRPGSVLAQILLPWLAFASLRAVRSWSASATAALLFAAILACAPSLGPVLVLLWLGALALTGRYVARFLAIPLPAAILFAPLIVWHILQGNPLGLLADPGATVTFSAAPNWQLMLGFPEAGLGGWSTIFSTVGPTFEPVALIILIALVGILAALAVVGLFSPTPIRAQLALLVMLFGVASAVAAVHVGVAFAGQNAVPLWPGSALGVAWLALMVGAATGVAVLRRFAIYPAVAGLTAVVLLAVPTGVGLFRGETSVASTDGQTLPAYVVARSITDQQLGTLILSAQPDGGLSVQIQRGFGATLNNSSTAVNTAVRPTESATQLADLAANLSSLSSNDSRQQLREWGIGSVLVTPLSAASTTKPSSSEAEMRARVSVALDANPQLEIVGFTDYGTLWRFANPDTQASQGLTPAGATQPWRWLILLIQGIVLLMTLLLAVPTGMPQRDIRPRRAIAGLATEPIAFEPRDPLREEADDEHN